MSACVSDDACAEGPESPFSGWETESCAGVVIHAERARR